MPRPVHLARELDAEAPAPRHREGRLRGILGRGDDRPGDHQVQDADGERVVGIQLDKHLQTIQHLHSHCEGNLVRVHEELEAQEIINIPSSTLTGFCRREGIGCKPRIPAAAASSSWDPL